MNPNRIATMRTSFVGFLWLQKLVDALESAGDLNRETSAKLIERMNATKLVSTRHLERFTATNSPLECLEMVADIAAYVTPTQMNDFDAAAAVLIVILEQEMKRVA